MTATARVPTVAVDETETFATRLVADTTVVALTVTPAPKVARVPPATKAVLAEPAIRTLRLLAPSCAEVTSGSEIWTTSSDFPVLAAPVTLLTTLSAVVPTGSPVGTVTVRRRRPVAALSVVTAEAVADTGGPDAGVKVTALFAAAASNPVPVTEIATDDDAPIGLTVDSVPLRATGTPRAALRLQSSAVTERTRVRNREPGMGPNRFTGTTATLQDDAAGN